MMRPEKTIGCLHVLFSLVFTSVSIPLHSFIESLLFLNNFGTHELLILLFDEWITAQKHAFVEVL